MSQYTGPLSDKNLAITLSSLVNGFNDVSEDKSLSISNKIEALKTIFSSIASTAMQDISFAKQNYEYLDMAVSRTIKVLDVMNDDDFTGAPLLVQMGELDKPSGSVVTHIWTPLAEHRKKVSDDLRVLLNGMHKRQAEINEIKCTLR